MRSSAAFAGTAAKPPLLSQFVDLSDFGWQFFKFSFFFVLLGQWLVFWWLVFWFRSNEVLQTMQTSKDHRKAGSFLCFVVTMLADYFLRWIPFLDIKFFMQIQWDALCRGSKRNFSMEVYSHSQLRFLSSIFLISPSILVFFPFVLVKIWLSKLLFRKSLDHIDK